MVAPVLDFMVAPVLDFAIITVLDKERTAVCREFGIDDNHQMRAQTEDTYKYFPPTYWRQRFLQSNNSNLFYEIAVFQLSDQGNVSACQLTTLIIDTFDPKVVLLVGIAGGVDSQQQELGDIIVGKDIYYYERGKETSEGISREPKMISIKPETLNKVNGLPNFVPSIQVDKPDGTTTPPKKHHGVIASGDKVIANEAVSKEIQQGNRKIQAIEMEGYGFSYAARNSNQGVEYLVIRGISDFADDKKDDAWHKYAAAAAANFAKHLVLNFGIELRNMPQPLTNLDEHLKAISKSLNKGKLIFFLGSGINSGEGNTPPTDQQIIDEMKKDAGSGRKLEELIGLPCSTCAIKLSKRPEFICPIRRQIEESKDGKPQLPTEQDLALTKLELQCQAQFIINKHSEGNLIKNLNGFLCEKNDANFFHENIAKLAVSAGEEENGYPLIVTTNYDMGLETAFQQQQKEIKVLSYIARLDGGEAGKFEVICGDQNKEEKPIIVKLYGGYNKREKNKTNSFAIAEVHHINFYQKIKLPEEAKPYFKEGDIKEGDILFIGYSANDNFLRSILENFCPERWKDDLSAIGSKFPKGWLVQQSKPGILSNEDYWKHWNIELIDYPWKDFLEKLKDWQHIK